MTTQQPSITKPTIERTACARIPTIYGEFELCHYRNSLDDKEHLALVVGDVAGASDVLVRVHSECFTGDVLGSLRCDCGPQLDRAMQLIAQEKRGVVVYMRQEGRNIGLLDKLRAYNLQDAGYDTVEANLMLGHQADDRDYTFAALILQDLGISSVRLLTNNPSKIEGLSKYGIRVDARVPLQEGVNEENIGYLETKARRMRHMLELDLLPKVGEAPNGRPLVTVTYAQSLDGSIAARPGEPTALSGPESLAMTHRLRTEHDAILIGIGTVLSDNPRLTTRLVTGRNPQPIILDSNLRFPTSSRLLQGPLKPWIATLASADPQRKANLERAGARVITMPSNAAGMVALPALLACLQKLDIASLMVEGGATVITNFLAEGLADRLVLTITPALLGGTRPFTRADDATQQIRLPQLRDPHYQQMGHDIVLIAGIVP
jgi:3,4-dihydroxy 2-butanone 4-phosphate synthase/GTP cyclohydrolase II